MKKNDEMIMESLRKEIEKNAENVQVPLRLQKESIVAMLRQEQKKDEQTNKDFSVETGKRNVVEMPKIAAATTNGSDTDASGTIAINPGRNIKHIQRMAAMAAAMAIVISSVLFMKGNMPSARVRLDAMALKGMSASKLKEVDNSAELENAINQILNKNATATPVVIPETTHTQASGNEYITQQIPSSPIISTEPQFTQAPDTATPEAVGGYENLVLVKESEPVNTGILGVGDSIHGDDYEADFVKESGEHLYVVSVVTDGETGLVSEEVQIIRKTPPESMSVVSKITLTDHENPDVTDNCIEIHIKNDMLIAILSRTNNADGAVSTVAAYYFISDPMNPVKIREHIQDGEYVSSSLCGNNLCLVTDKTLRVSAENVPSFSVNGAECVLDTTSEIRIVNDPDTSYIFITVTDVADFNKKVGRLAVIGCGKNISCFEESIVVAREFVSAQADEDGKYQVKTEFCRFNIDGTSITDAGIQLVDGKLAGRVSVDEESGCIKAITIDEGVSNIYVFDKEMSVLSASSCETEGTVNSTKFIGTNGYIILTDEDGKEKTLVIDFSNPGKPAGAGMVETDGFSDSFCSITDSLVLGIRTEEVYVEKEIYVDGAKVDPDSDEEYTGQLETVTIKSELVTFMLFDLSNPEKPVAVDSYSFAKDGGIEFTLQDAEGIVVDSKEEIFGVPVIIYDSETQKETSAYMIFDVSEKALKNTMILNHSEAVVGSSASRGICSDGIFYTVSGEKVAAFSAEDGSMISSI